jgi:hypothetical protein
MFSNIQELSEKDLENVISGSAGKCKFYIYIKGFIHPLFIVFTPMRVSIRKNRFASRSKDKVFQN